MDPNEVIFIHSVCKALCHGVCRVRFKHIIYMFFLVYFMIRYRPCWLNLCKTYHFTCIIDNKSHMSCQNTCLIFDYAKIFIVNVVNWYIQLIRRYLIIPVSTVVF